MTAAVETIWFWGLVLAFCGGRFFYLVELLNYVAQNSSCWRSVFLHDRDGIDIEGQILRLNSKTVSILADDSRQWNVPPAFLRLVKSVLDKS